MTKIARQWMAMVRITALLDEHYYWSDREDRYVSDEYSDITMMILVMGRLWLSL
jgi:hypothetical protein